MKPLHRRILIFVVSVTVIGVAYLGYNFFTAWEQDNVPQAFSEARSDGTLIAEKMVENSNEIATAIASLNEGSQDRDTLLATIEDIQVKVEELRGQAIQFSGTLEIMLESLPGIRIVDAQNAALQAITQHLSLVDHLIAYSDKVTRLATAIQLRSLTGADNGEQISDLIQEINAEVASINNYGRAANQFFAQLDALLR